MLDYEINCSQCNSHCPESKTPGGFILLGRIIPLSGWRRHLVELADRPGVSGTTGQMIDPSTEFRY
jgi:hypothetical protein